MRGVVISGRGAYLGVGEVEDRRDGGVRHLVMRVEHSLLRVEMHLAGRRGEVRTGTLQEGEGTSAAPEGAARRGRRELSARAWWPCWLPRWREAALRCTHHSQPTTSSALPVSGSRWNARAWRAQRRRGKMRRRMWAREATSGFV